MINPEALIVAMHREAVEAESKAWKSLAKHKYWMFGYWAARAVTLYKLPFKAGEKGRFVTPFRELVEVARRRSSP